MIHFQNQNTEQQNVPQPTIEPFVPQGSASAVPVPQGEGGYVDEGWSWGSFALNYMFLIAIRKYEYLYVLILFLIPIVNIFAGFGMIIYLGMNGRELARNSRTFSNHEQYLGFMKGIDHAGKIISYVMLPVFALGVIVSVFIVFFLGNAIS